jgi:hypothetical protein
VENNVPHKAGVLDRDLHCRLALRLRLEETLWAHIPIGLRPKTDCAKIVTQTQNSRDVYKNCCCIGDGIPRSFLS